MTLGAQAARTGTGVFKSVNTLLGWLEDSLSLVETGDGVALHPGSLQYPIRLHFSGSFRTVGLGSRMLVAGSISSIMMDPMHFMSARPLSTGKPFRSRIDSAMLAALRGQPHRSTLNLVEFTDLDISVLVQGDVAAAECAMMK